jgi:hypothetical protein
METAQPASGVFREKLTEGSADPSVSYHMGNHQRRVPVRAQWLPRMPLRVVHLGARAPGKQYE